MIEVTDEMREVAWNALPVDAQESAGLDLDDMAHVLRAAFALIDPVPDEVRVIHGNGWYDDYVRVRGSNVYRAECGCYYTYAEIAAMGPVSW